MSVEYVNLISSDEEEEYTTMEVIDLTQVDDSIATRTNCIGCGYRFEKYNPPLSDQCSDVVDLCVGCCVMRETIRKSGENIADVQRWLLTGDIIFSHYIHNINNDKELKKISNQVGFMRQRFHRLRDQGRTNPLYDQGLPTKDQIKQLVIDTECKCGITGWVCHRTTSQQKSWTATLDHIVPLSTAPPAMNPWTISNIQVMCYLLNQIKGSHPDVEVVRWFTLWRAYNMQK